MQSFCVWFVSFSITFSRLIHVAENGRISFFFMARQCSIVYTYYVFFICSFVYEHFFLSYLFIYFWLCWVADVGFLWLLWTRAALTCGARLSAGASLVVEHRHPACGLLSFSVRVGSTAHRLQSVRQGLSCWLACGTFPDQGLNPCPQHWLEGGFLSIVPPGIRVYGHLGFSIFWLYE